MTKPKANPPAWALVSADDVCRKARIDRIREGMLKKEQAMIPIAIAIKSNSVGDWPLKR